MHVGEERVEKPRHVRLRSKKRKCFRIELGGAQTKMIQQKMDIELKSKAVITADDLYLRRLDSTTAVTD